MSIPINLVVNDSREHLNKHLKKINDHINKISNGNLKKTDDFNLQELNEITKRIESDIQDLKRTTVLADVVVTTLSLISVFAWCHVAKRIFKRIKNEKKAIMITLVFSIAATFLTIGVAFYFMHKIDKVKKTYI